MAPDGVVTSQFVAPGVNPITFSADGRLFVAQAILPYGDTLGNSTRRLWPSRRRSGAPARDPFPQQLNGFDFGPDGMLYAPQPYLGTVIRLDLSADHDPPQVVATGLSFPTAVKFDSRGRLFAVASADDGQVVRIDVAAGKTHLVSTVPTGLSGLDNLAFGPRDELYCTGGGDGSVWRILPSGVARNLSRGGLNIPTDVATAPGNGRGHPVSLYVGNVFGYYKFDARTGHDTGRTVDVVRGKRADHALHAGVLRRRPGADVVLHQQRAGLGSRHGDVTGRVVRPAGAAECHRLRGGSGHRYDRHRWRGHQADAVGRT